MGKKTFLFSIGLIIGFLLLISLSDFNLAQAVMCSGRGGFCGYETRLMEDIECCAGVCADGSCSCLSNCCSLTSSIDGDRGDDCYCGRECRGGLTCIGSTCCDDRSDWKRKAGVACYCHVECESGQCIGGVCAGADTCSPAGCACIDTIINCERLIGGEHDPSLTCSDPSYNVCCCPLELPPPDGDGLCDSPCNPPCTCIYRFCSGDSVPIDCCGGSVEYVCCCPTDTPPPPGSICQGYSDASRSCACADTGVCRGDNGDNIGMIDCSDIFICCCIPVGEVRPPDCGDGVIDPGEECEIDEDCLSGMTCVNCSCIEEGFVVGDNGGIIDLQSPLGCTTIEECISRMINFLFSLAVILTPLMIILAGFLYITAAGRPEKIVQAQKLITWTLIGFLIVSLARAIIYVITSVIGG